MAFILTNIKAEKMDMSVNKGVYKFLIAVLITTFLLSACFYKAPPFDEVKWRNDTSHQNPALLYAPHVKDGKFYNPWMPMDRSGFGGLEVEADRKNVYSDEEMNFKPDFVPDLKNELRKCQAKILSFDRGHSTFLIRINGEYWLTDPMFSERALLPKRKTPPAISLEEMNGLNGKPV